MGKFIEYIIFALFILAEGLVGYTLWINGIAIYDFIYFMLFECDLEGNNIGFFFSLFVVSCCFLLLYIILLLCISLPTLLIKDFLPDFKWFDKYFYYYFQLPIVEVPIFILRYPIKIFGVIGLLQQLFIINTIHFTNEICIDLLLFKLIFNLNALIYLTDIVLIVLLFKYFKSFKIFLIKFPQRDY